MSTQIPHHIAIIMDGNGRWAQMRGLPRTAGHKKGLDAARAVTHAAGKQGVKWLTLFGFSTENWSRPEGEINDLMGLLRIYLRAEAADLHKNNIRLRVIGFRHRLAKDIITQIEEVEELTQNNDGLQLCIALDYGGRQDIVEATRLLIENGTNASDVTEDLISETLMTKDIPDPDLVIRSSGEMRISNFLLWQSAYSEFLFSDVMWPDFDGDSLAAAIQDYTTRDRRYGGVHVKQDQVASS